MNYRHLLILIAALFIGASAHAQPLRKWIAAADSTFARRDFHSAFKYADAALRYDTTRIDLWHLYAESAFEFQAYPSAIQGYQRVLNSDQRGNYPRTVLRMAQAHQILGNYDQAALLFQRFIDEQPGAAAEDLAAADKGIRDIQYARQILQNPGNLEVRRLGEGINSPYSEFGAIYHNDTLYYSSFQFTFPKDTRKPPRRIHKIMTSVGGAAGKPLPEYFNEPDKHVAHTAFSHDFSRIYYTLCEYTGAGDADIRCELYLRERAGQGWGPAQKLSVNVPGYTTTQPTTAYDPDSGVETLYFVSDRPGGRGNLDIWSAQLTSPGGACSTPVNVTALNTPGNDVTPFFHGPTKTMYFSSDGYPGLGGYDIFRAAMRGAGWETPQNLGAGINSSFHDVYYALNEAGTSALLSSNRPGATLLDKKSDVCCHDIWEVELAKPFKLKAFTFDKLDGSSLADVKVQVFELMPDGSQKLVATQVNPTANDFSFSLMRGKRYLIKGTKEGFLPASETIDLNDPAFADKDEAEVKLYLEPTQIQLSALTFSRPDNQPLNAATVKLYEIMPDGSERLVASKENPTANDFSFALTPGRKYRIEATRPGYNPATETFDLNDPALAGKSVIEKKLYLDPAPLTLEVLTLREDRRPLPEATVTLLEVTPEGRERPLVERTNDTGNLFTFSIEPGRKYVIRGVRELYLPATETLDLSKPELAPPGNTIRKELIFRQNTSVVDVLTFDARTRQGLDSVKVTVYRINPDGSRELVTTDLKPNQNNYQFELLPGFLYEVVGERPGYAPVQERLDLRNNPGPLTARLYLPPSERELEVTTFRRPDGQPLPAVQVELFEVKPSGEHVFITSRTNPVSNDLRFPIETGKQYLLSATHPGYLPATEPLNMRDPALQNQPVVKKQIYLMPAQVNLEVSTLRRADRAPVNGSTVRLYEVGPDGKETLVTSRTNKDGNSFNFPLAPGKLYILRGDHPSYHPVEERIDLRDPATAASGTLRKELLFEHPLPVKTFDAQLRTPLAGVRIELMELDATRPRSVFKENPEGNDFSFPVMPDKRYLLTAERQGYRPVTDTIRIPSDPNQRLDTVKVYLRQKNFDELLPLSLYFDNDHPNPRTTLSTTTLDYSQTFDRYYARKQEYIDEFTKGEKLSDEERFLIEQSYIRFFDRSLKGGYRDLQAFSDKLLEFLQEGNTIEIELRGYSSPRGANDYNLYLSRRRASSVANYFYRYKNGALMPYIRSGKLRIGKIGFGEETPDPIRASDRYDDLKGSVFSTQACLARRVQIVDVKMQGTTSNNQ